MKALLMSLIASLFVLCSCDDGNDSFCDQHALLELMVVSSNCSTASYLSDNGYADYNECMDNDSRLVTLSIISCKGRDGIIP
jgi:hypothetical protein